MHPLPLVGNSKETEVTRCIQTFTFTFGGEKNTVLPRGMALVLFNQGPYYKITSLTGGVKGYLLALCRPRCRPGTVVDSSPFYDIRLASVGFGRSHQDTGCARIRYVEVQRVAEVAALGATVHGELVYVQVERQRHGGPQHPQHGRDATETSERRCPVLRGTPVGSRRHRPLPRTLLTQDREPWSQRRKRPDVPQRPVSRVSELGESTVTVLSVRPANPTALDLEQWIPRSTLSSSRPGPARSWRPLAANSQAAGWRLACGPGPGRRMTPAGFPQQV